MPEIREIEVSRGFLAALRVRKLSALAFYLLSGYFIYMGVFFFPGSFFPARLLLIVVAVFFIFFTKYFILNLYFVCRIDDKGIVITNGRSTLRIDLQQIKKFSTWPIFYQKYFNTFLYVGRWRLYVVPNDPSFDLPGYLISKSISGRAP